MGKRINYQEQIKESSTELENLLKKASSSLIRDRLRYLLLLKTGKAKTQKEASAQINIGLRQGQRNWELYRTKGIVAYQKRAYGGRPSKLKESEEQELLERLKADDIQFLDEAVLYVSEQYGQTYTRSGMHRLFKRLKVKKKTGRPTNIRQDKEGLKHFKKTI